MTLWLLIAWFGRGAVLAQWFAVERSWSRWLPWWRRYLSAFIWLLMCLSDLIGYSGSRANLCLFALACVVFVWNRITSQRNRDNNRDMRKLEASRSERLTEVQQASFRRQATEAA